MLCIAPTVVCLLTGANAWETPAPTRTPTRNAMSGVRCSVDLANVKRLATHEKGAQEIPIAHPPKSASLVLAIQRVPRYKGCVSPKEHRTRARAAIAPIGVPTPWFVCQASARKRVTPVRVLLPIQPVPSPTIAKQPWAFPTVAFALRFHRDKPANES